MNRLQLYKHHGKDFDDLRRRRNETNISLRKNKRDEQIEFKRHLILDETHSDNEAELTIHQIVRQAQSSNPTLRYQAVRSARKLLSIDRQPPIDEFIQLNFLPTLVQCLSLDRYPEIQFEATWALTNIASGNTQQTQAVVQANALPYLIRLLNSTNSNVCEQAVWAIGNLIGDGPQIRDYAIELGLISPLIDFIRRDISLTFLRNLTWVLVNLCRHKHSPLALNSVQIILPAFRHLLNYSDITILIDCTWALAYLLECGQQMIQLIVQSDFVPYLVSLLNHSEIKIVTAALRAVGTIVTGSDEQTQIVLDQGVLNYFSYLLKHPKDKLVKEAVWFLSNITAGTQQQIQLFVNAQLIPDVIQHLQYSELVIQKEAAWCISNLTMNGSSEQVQHVVNQHVLPALCYLLHQLDVNIIQICLDAIANILRQTFKDNLENVKHEIEECGGLESIENLQNHVSQQISRQAFEIIEKYYSNIDDHSSMGEVPHRHEYPLSIAQTVPDSSSFFQF